MEAMTTLDFRTLQRRHREALVFSLFECLQTGGALTLIHDQDFGDLKKQLESVALTNIEWNELQAGPHLWKLMIKKIEEKSEGGKGCGICEGHGHSWKPST